MAKKQTVEKTSKPDATKRLRAALKRAKGDAASLKETCKIYKKRCDERDREYDRMNKRLNEAEEKIAELEGENAKLRESLAESSKYAEELDDDNRKETCYLNDNIDKRDKAIRRLRKAWNALGKYLAKP